MLDEQALGTFNRDRQRRSVLGERGVEIGESGDIMSDAALEQAFAVAAQDAELCSLPPQS